MWSRKPFITRLGQTLPLIHILGKDANAKGTFIDDIIKHQIWNCIVGREVENCQTFIIWYFAILAKKCQVSSVLQFFIYGDISETIFFFEMICSISL